MFFFFFNDTATTEIYTLSLHDALPISASPDRHRRLIEDLRDASERSRHPPGVTRRTPAHDRMQHGDLVGELQRREAPVEDRKSTRLNSSHANISYAVFCLKKKKKYDIV